MEWCGSVVERTASGVETQQGRLRAAAQAVLAGATGLVEHRATLGLLGIKAVRAFDGWVVIARVNGEAGGLPYRLLGSASCEDDEDLPRTAALAVLNATNRVLEKLLVQPSPNPPSNGPEPSDARDDHGYIDPAPPPAH